MIRDSVLSKEKLGKFFMNSPDFTELNIPEITRFSTSTINNLVINNSNIKKIIMPYLEQQPGIILGANLEEVDIPSLQLITNMADVIPGGILTSKFLQNTKLQRLNLPELKGTLNEETDISSANQIGFARNYWLREVSLGNAYLTKNNNASFGRFWFYYNYSLQKLALRYPFVLPLANITGLATTPISYQKGFIYVPDNLVEEYQRAASWSNFASQFRPLTQIDNPTQEDLIKLNYDTLPDEKYTWEQIVEMCNNNSLTGDFVVGATKTVTINGMPTQMVIAHLNRDPKSDGSGNAAITWIEKHISRYNPISMSVSSTDIKNYSNITNFHSEEKENIFNGLPTVLKENIKSVKKSTFGWIAVDSQGIKVTDEKIWIPSAAELGLSQSAGTQIEADLPYQYFEDVNNRVFKFGYTDRTPVAGVNQVALRTFTSSSNYADSIDSNGRFVSGSNSQFPQYLIIGFCT